MGLNCKLNVMLGESWSVGPFDGDVEVVGISSSIFSIITICNRNKIHDIH
jgi:hypothetical protein